MGGVVAGVSPTLLPDSVFWLVDAVSGDETVAALLVVLVASVEGSGVASDDACVTNGEQYHNYTV